MQTITNGIGMTFVPVPEGSFLMGIGAPELASAEPFSESYPPHRVEMRGPRAMSTHLVRVCDWIEVQGNLGQRKMRSDPHLPMAYVSWHDAMEFCQMLSAMPVEAAEGRKYRLPTEAEWEYMCRAGSEGLFAHGITENNLAEYAWYRDSWRHLNDHGTPGRARRMESMPVGMLKPNSWGAFDMNGNVHEWCLDSYDPTIYALLRDYTVVNPVVLRLNESPTARGVVRGGCVNSPALRCSCGVRWLGGRSKAVGYLDVGFRVVLDLDIDSLVNVTSDLFG